MLQQSLPPSIKVFPEGKEGASQPWIIATSAPAVTTHGVIDIRNDGDTAIPLKLYVVDGELKADGGFGMAIESALRRDMGRWIKLDTTQITMAPHSYRSVEYSIVTPFRVQPGHHYGGVIVQPAQARTISVDGMDVQMVQRFGIRVYYTVTGSQRPVSHFRHHMHHSSYPLLPIIIGGMFIAIVLAVFWVLKIKARTRIPF